jgi:hypothetical protein
LCTHLERGSKRFGGDISSSNPNGISSLLPIRNDILMTNYGTESDISGSDAQSVSKDSHSFTIDEEARFVSIIFNSFFSISFFLKALLFSDLS